MYALQQPRTNWTPSGGDLQPSEGIPHALRLRLEALMRCDFSAVRLQVDLSLARLGVLAAAEGGRIHLSPRAPDLKTPAGVAILGHELAHVMQQRQGRVRALHDDLVVVDDAALEREADQAGLHCAASLFSGVMTDPGWPETLRGGAPSQDTAGLAPVQFKVSAQESFADFAMLAFNQLAGDYGHLKSAECEARLRSICYRYRSDKVYAKLPLDGASYCKAMNALLDAMKGYLVRVQRNGIGSWPFLPSDRSALTKYFTDRGNAFTKDPLILTWPPVPSIGVSSRKEAKEGASGSQSLSELNNTYLHVFVEDPQDIPITWRICLNVRPEGILDAVIGIGPLMKTYPCINHMKFAVPLITNKADLVIVYMNAAHETFALAREEIRKLVPKLPLQARVGAMLDEVIDGVGEGSEASNDGDAKKYYASFTEVRSRIFYVAFHWMFTTVVETERLFPAFLDALHWVMPCLGLDPANPQMQSPFDGWTSGSKADLVRQLYLGVK